MTTKVEEDEEGKKECPKRLTTMMRMTGRGEEDEE